MDIGAIDTSATAGSSWLHRASPVAKLLAFALTISAVVVTWNVLVAGALTLVLVAAAVSASLNLRLAFGLAGYAAFFAVVFAIASAPDLLIGSVIVLKALTAALAAIVLALTTPYPQIFAPVQRVVPTLVGDALLMTYRSSFLMLGKLSDVLRAIRLRAGLRGLRGVRSAAATAQALGGATLYSLDLAQRDYDVLRLRGYEGRLRARLPASRSRVADTVTLAVAASMLATAVLWRVDWRALNPYSWLPLALALVAVLWAAFQRGRAR